MTLIVRESSRRSMQVTVVTTWRAILGSKNTFLGILLAYDEARHYEFGKEV